MLKGLEIAEVKRSNINLGDRYDAEYFHKNNLLIENVLKNLGALQFREYGDFVASAFYPSATELYHTGTIPFIRCVDCIPYPFITKKQDDVFEKLPLSFIMEQNGINTLKKGDIVITKVGSPCYASLVDEHDFVALSRTVLGVKNIKSINEYYLVAFLRSKYGFNQLLRERELTIQYQLTLDRVKNILVYLPSEDLQKHIERVIKYQNVLDQKSKSLYSEAEVILLQELGLTNWQPTIENYNTKTLKDSFLETGRLDAEYYQPKYDEVLRKITHVKNAILGSLITVQKSIEPGSEAYQNEGVPFIRVADLSKYGITEGSVYLSIEDYDSFPLMPKRNTILLSKDGSVGIAYKVEADVYGVTSSAILHLTLESSEVLPDYLCLVINSIIVKLQAERDAGGSIIQHWKPDEIKQVVIPILDLEFQEVISVKVQEAFALQKQSKHFLEVAKLAIELAIEQNEEVAIKYLNENSYA